MVENHLLENSRGINKLRDIMERTSNDVKILVKHFQMVQTQIDQLTKVQKDLLVNAAREKQVCEIRTRGGATTQDPLYPEGHPKRIEQDSQRNSSDDIPSYKKKKKKHKTTAKSSEAGKDPNSVSISDAETEPGNASDKEEVEEKPEKIDKNAKYTK
jgi:pyridoxal biosynthesis lyase PdxS